MAWAGSVGLDLFAILGLNLEGTALLAWLEVHQQRVEWAVGGREADAAVDERRLW